MQILSHCLRRSLLLIAAVASAGVSSASAQSADWPYWRGPEFNGKAEASGLPEDWDPDGGEGSNLLWKRDELGGRSTPIIMNGRLYTTLRAEPGTPREGERVVCLDAATGEQLWENRFNVWLSDVPDTRVGWASVVGDPETGNVYCLGACDIFLCIDGETGETLWSIPLHEQFGMLSTYGGRTNFPIVHEDLVIVSGIIINWGDRAKPNHRLIGLDKRTGEIVWFGGTRDLPYDTTYSSPSLVTIDGQRQLVMGTGDGAIWGIQPRTGKRLWHYDLSRRGIFSTPLVVGNQIFASHSEENIDGATMGAVASMKVSGTGDATQVEELWKLRRLVIGRSAPVLVDGRLYIVDDRCKMWVIDAETGDMIAERISLGDRKQWPSLLYADGKIYVLTENGRWAVVKPTEDGAEIINRGRLRDEAFYASPIVADGRLYFQGTSALYCVGTGDGQQKSVNIAEAMGEELPVAKNPQPAQVQLVPAEGLIRPGASIEYEVRLYNELGQRLEDPQASGVSFEVEGPGSVEGSTFTASPKAAHTAATLYARVGDLEGSARVRIVPDLPWKFTFDGMDSPPISWIGARYRHVVRNVDGSPALVKVTTIPKGARSRAWMGHSDLKNYTISADVRGAKTEDQLPDIGLTAMGYVLDLMGNSQQLQIRTWSPQLRMAQTIDFPWQPDQWYRMKFRAEHQGEGEDKVAVLRGKVWPRDEPEPEEWTITARDQAPNPPASPGLFGNATVAELYLDNIEVTSNEDEG